MEDEIKVGEYVRTKFSIGEFKYLGGLDYELVYFKNCDGLKCVNKGEVVKHSPNIIDLIECGDYVNGYKVIDVMENLETGELNLEMESSCPTPEFDCQLYNKDIKSIVTHEQFKFIEYTVKE